MSAIEKQSDNQVHNPEVSNAGGTTIPMDGSYLSDLLAKDTYSETALYPVREKTPRASSNTLVSATSPDALLAAVLVTPKTALDARQTFERTPTRRSTSYRDATAFVDRKVIAPFSNTPVSASPPMGAPHVNMEVGAISPQALLLQHKFKEAEYVQFEQLPNIREFRPWRLKFFTKIAAACGRGEAGTIWISEIGKVSSIEELTETDQSWGQFSMVVCAGLMELISGDFKRQITFLEEKLMTESRLLNGRQLAFLIWERFKRGEMEIGVTEFYDLRNIRLNKGNDLRKFLMDWDECIFGVRKEQDPDYLLSLFDEQVSQCTHFQQTYALYRADCTHHGLENNYVNLRKWVQAHMESRSQESKKRQLLRTEDIDLQLVSMVLATHKCLRKTLN